MNIENRKTILFVEDKVVAARLHKKELENCGYVVVTANNGEKAVDIFRDNKSIDLILMDVNLGNGINGAEAAEIILKERDLPIIFLSSHTEPEIVKKTEKVLSYGYVVKNSGITVLDASIKTAFRIFNSNKKTARVKVF